MAKELLKKVQQLHQTVPTGIVSAMRGIDSPTAKRLDISVERFDNWNKDNTLELERMIKAAGFSYIKLLGSYPEAGGSKVREKSFLVYSESGKDPRDFVISAGQKFDQDSVIATKKASEAELIFTNDTADEPKGTVITLGGLELDSGSEWASELEDEPGSKFAYVEGATAQVVNESVAIYSSLIKSMKL